MIKITDTEVVGWEHAIRGMRNPLNSWDKSDSEFGVLYNGNPSLVEVKHDIMWYDYIGPNDQKLMMHLVKAGTDHRKFMRMIVVYCDILAPLYWWKEFDTYKVGTVANSCSTMHCIHKKEFTLDDFSHEHLMNESIALLKDIIKDLNECRKWYLDTKDKTYWWQMIQLLPSSYNQRRTVMLNYETLYRIHESRTGHKLDEWNIMCKWIESLPYSELLTERRTDGAVETH